MTLTELEGVGVGVVFDLSISICVVAEEERGGSVERAGSTERDFLTSFVALDTLNEVDSTRDDPFVVAFEAFIFTCTLSENVCLCGEPGSFAMT